MSYDAQCHDLVKDGEGDGNDERANDSPTLLAVPSHLGTEWTTHLADNGEGDGNDERVNDSPTLLAVPPHPSGH